MIFSTTNEIPGYRISKIIGVVTGTSVRASGPARDLVAKIKDVLGGKVKGYRDEIDRCILDAVEDMLKKAKSAGAHGVIGVTVNVSTLYTEKGGFFIALSAGTAVELTEISQKKELREEDTSGETVNLQNSQKNVADDKMSPLLPLLHRRD